MELGLGSIGYSYENILDASDAGQLSGIQAQFDYDFIQGPFRAAIGIKAIALTGYTFIQPGVKLGKDIINLNISVLPSGLTYYGLSSRIGFGPNKQHAIDLSLQGAANFDYGFGGGDNNGGGGKGDVGGAISRYVDENMTATTGIAVAALAFLGIVAIGSFGSSGED